MTSDNTTSSKRRPLWRRVLKWTAVAVGSLALLAVAATACVVWLLSPETLTSMVERYSGEFIDGHVKPVAWS